MNVYELWVPACFIKFDYKYRDDSEDIYSPISSRKSRSTYEKVKVKPDGQFTSYYHSLEAGMKLSNKS